MTWHSILVPLDGSEFAESVLPIAAGLARGAGARLRLALVHQPHPLAGGEAGPVPVPDLDLRVRETEYLGRVAARLEDEDGPEVLSVFADGEPGPALEDLVRSGGDSLVVMATHGRGAFSRFWLGSTADYLVRHLDVPVLLVRPGASGAVDPTLPLRHAVVPLDASSLSERVLEPAMELLRLAGPGIRQITLVHVIEPVLGVGEPGLPFAVPIEPQLFARHQGEVERRLHRVAERLRGELEGLEVEVTVVSSALAAPAIVETATARGARFIAMTTHGQRGLRRVVLGSVTDKVVRSAECPVLVFRPPVPVL